MKFNKFKLFLTIVLMPCVLFAADAPLKEAAQQPAAAQAKPTAEAKPVADNDTLKPYSTQYYQKFVTAAWLEKKGNKEGALTEYIALDAATPKDITIVKSIANIAIDREAQPVMDKYIPMLMELDPKHPDTLSIYATWLWSKGQIKEALSYYEKALAIDGDNPFTIYKYITLLSTVDSDRAVKYLEGITLSYPKVAGTISLQIADLYLSANDPAQALSYLKQATKQNPGLEEPYLGRAKIYEHQGKSESALSEYLAMEKVGLADSNILTKIGAYYVLSSKKDLATDYFLKALSLENGAPLPCQFLSMFAEEKGDYDAAIKYVKQSSNYGQNMADMIRISYFLNKQGKLEEAAQNLKEVYSSFPDNAEAAYYYALALSDIKDYKGAAKIFKEILKNAPDSQAALLQYAFVLEKQKKYKPMQKNLRRLLQLQPDNAAALNFLGYYLIDKTKHLDEGGDYIKKAIALAPQDAAIIDSIGWYYFKKGDYDKALALVKEAASIVGDDAEILSHLALIYQAQGDDENASKYFEKVLQLEPKNKAAKKGLKSSLKRINKQKDLAKDTSS